MRQRATRAAAAAACVAAAAVAAASSVESLLPSQAGRLVLGLRAGAPGSDDMETGAAAPYFVDLIDTATGAVEATLALPPAAITAYAPSNAEGVVTASGDGRLVVVSGYAAPLGFLYPASESWETMPRVVAAIDCAGGVATLQLTASVGLADGGNIRSAATYDGRFYYASSEDVGVMLFANNTGGGGGATPSVGLRLDADEPGSTRALGFRYNEAVSPARVELLLSVSGSSRGVYAFDGVPVTPASCAPLPGFAELTGGNPQQWVFESPSRLWLAELGLSQWALGGPAWVKVNGTVGVPPAPGSDASPAVRGLVGRAGASAAEFTLFVVPADPLIGSVLPRILAYVPAADKWRTLATSPSASSVYKGVALPPACAATLPTPAPSGVPTPQPSPQPPPPSTAVVTSSATAAGVGEGDAVTLSVSVSGAPSELDFLALFAPADADTATTAPLRVVGLAAATGGAYTATGSATVTVQLFTLPGGWRAAVMRGNADSGATAEQPYPNFDGWLGSGVVALPGGGVALPLAAPRAPVRLRVTPGSSAGDAVVSWTAAGAPLERPLLRWATAVTPDGRALAGTIVEAPARESRIERDAYCPDVPDASLVSLARGAGWVDLGWHYSANLSVSSSMLATATEVSFYYYTVGDGAADPAVEPARWSPVTLLTLAPPPAVVVGGGAGTDGGGVSTTGAAAAAGPPYSLLVVADTGVGVALSDDSVPFRNRGLISWHGAFVMANEIRTLVWRGPNTVVGLALVGDLNYGDGLVGTFADWGAQVAPLTAGVPVAHATGNHESAWGARGRGDVWTRAAHSGGECNVPPHALYPQPRGASADEPWYYSLHGVLALVHMSSEHNFTTGSRQWIWLRGVLQSLNRDVAPFVVLLTHRPMALASNQVPTAARTDGHLLVAALLREHVGPLVAAYDVTLVLGGHHHSYQRHCVLDAGAPPDAPACAVSAVNETLPPLDDPSSDTWVTAVYRARDDDGTRQRGPVHINCGNGGVEFDAGELTGSTLERFVFEHGFGLLVASPAGDALEWRALAYGPANVTAAVPPFVREGTVLDRVRIVQNATAIAARQRARAAAAVAAGGGGWWSLSQMVAADPSSVPGGGGGLGGGDGPGGDLPGGGGAGGSGGGSGGDPRLLPALLGTVAVLALGTAGLVLARNGQLGRLAAAVRGGRGADASSKPGGVGGVAEVGMRSGARPLSSGVPAAGVTTHDNVLAAYVLTGDTTTPGGGGLRAGRVRVLAAEAGAGV